MTTRELVRSRIRKIVLDTLQQDDEVAHNARLALSAIKEEEYPPGAIPNKVQHTVTRSMVAWGLCTWLDWGMLPVHEKLEQIRRHLWLLEVGLAK